MEQLGHSHMILREDGENAVQSLLRAAKESVAATIKVDIQASPPGSHASVGEAEKFHDTLAGQVRTILHRVESKSGFVIAPPATMFPWAIRHACYLLSRFHLRTCGTTAYHAATGSQVKVKLAEFGETGHGRVAEINSVGKSEQGWYKRCL